MGMELEVVEMAEFGGAMVEEGMEANEFGD